MRFHTDHHFRIGRAHLTCGMACQDYAMSGVRDGRAYAIVTDGCSSGGLTDVGARLVAHAAAVRLLGGAPVCLDELQRDLMLAPQDMLATCLSAHCTREECVVRLLGDGALVLVGRHGDIEIAQAVWRDNTPFYPAYTDMQRQRFIALHGRRADCLRLETVTVRGSLLDRHVTTLDVHAGMRGIERRLSRVELGGLEMIALVTDGVTQFPHLTCLDAVRSLVAFKSTAGRFVARRMNRFIRDCACAAGGPLDDVAMAAIRIDHADVAAGAGAPERVS